MSTVEPREQGDVMVTTLVFLAALLVASTILISASEQWEARRKAAAAAATMARAAAQGDVELVREGRDGIDPDRARRRVRDVLAALDRGDDETTYSGRILAVDGPIVTAEATASVDYTF
ncbi:MAG: hypothetical protein OEV40_16715, partial [Acidimicrobiia bacterium]|nr:hypothetical protein [Acidimicrobiia bacterium]